MEYGERPTKEGRRVGDIKLHERMATVEANQRSMEEGIGTLNKSITDLTDKIEKVTNKFSLAAGIFAAVIFFCEFIIIPIIFVALRNHIN